mmetsp:Transcript_12730/g.21600  ORF Transcript_12730/g.21600 Transcript_12730/m.21600 type:complete len:175 (-) Transcript_12730:145-669(-)|eukprot:CAMPEP_0198212850 /NCGR_PEP_ID=MMETSP1445-20131203/27933_1 /TAXON_ID=36898 /ORGANISM="Pyramimonas sp., Strain CCMP2087" /LENGTH=174 /DNA_ID=CAMNT_0043887399 /DNA_START=78 /DNA_END=602 /DNA_ORIENTATION=+
MRCEIEEIVEEPESRSSTWDAYNIDPLNMSSSSTSSSSSTPAASLSSSQSFAESLYASQSQNFVEDCNNVDIDQLNVTDPAFYQAQLVMLEAHRKRQERRAKEQKSQEWPLEKSLERISSAKSLMKRKVYKLFGKKSKDDSRMNDDKKTPVKGREIAGALAVQPNTDKKGYVVC